MTAGPSTPVNDPQAMRQSIRNADAPSGTLGLPDAVEGPGQAVQ